MTLAELREKVRRWDSDGKQVASSHFQIILNELEFHASRDWRVYLPAENTDNNSSYMERLSSWIGNLEEEKSQKLLLEYALQISFFSHDDFLALYQTALNREVTRWIGEKVGVSFEHGIEKYQNDIKELVHNRTWFCPITDSMDINEFYKINNLQGVGERPCFKLLHSIATHPTHPNIQTAEDWIRYMSNPHPEPDKCKRSSLEFIVLLEDVVGSGHQCRETIKWAVENLGKPVLFIPLIICPNGMDQLRGLENDYDGRLTVRPVLALNRGDMLGPERGANITWNGTVEMEALIQKCSTKSPFNYEAFGYRNTGSSLVTYSNTPDNTIPLVHDTAQSGDWNPLFIRVYRDS